MTQQTSELMGLVEHLREEVFRFGVASQVNFGGHHGFTNESSVTIMGDLLKAVSVLAGMIMAGEHQKAVQQLDQCIGALLMLETTAVLSGQKTSELLDQCEAIRELLVNTLTQ